MKKDYMAVEIFHIVPGISPRLKKFLIYRYCICPQGRTDGLRILFFLRTAGSQDTVSLLSMFFGRLLKTVIIDFTIQVEDNGRDIHEFVQDGEDAMIATNCSISTFHSANLQL